jgi:hypothetical protein
LDFRAAYRRVKPEEKKSTILARPLDLFSRPSYAELMSNPKKKGKAVMLGVGLDTDGHKRVTTGENFALVGGTEETHEVMTEKVIKINEKLKSQGKRLDTISSKEFDDIAEEVGLKKIPSQKSKRSGGASS